MPSLMDRIRHALGYQAPDPAEHARVDLRLRAQRIRLNTLDAAIEAQNAAPPKHPHRRATDRG
jgi:hypothetical protein